MGQSIEKSLHHNLVILSFLENGFEDILSSKLNVLSIWIEHVSVFWKFLSDEIESIFWESEGKCSKLLKSQFDYRKLLRKRFWSYREVKNDCSELLKRPFFYLFLDLSVKNLKPFFRKVRQSVQNYLIQNLVIGSFLEIGFEVTLSSNTNVLSVWKDHF